MSAVGRGRLRGAAPLAAALLLFTASLLVIEHRLQRLTGTLAEANSEPWWHLFQARFELERLLHALDRAAAVDSTLGGAAQLRVRFDVFWSRVDVLQGGTDNVLLRQLPDARPLLDELRGFLESEAPSFDAQPTLGELAELRAGLEMFEEPLQSLVVSSVQHSAAHQGAVQRRVRDLRSARWLSRVGLLGSASILVFLLHREVRQTRRLLERSEESRARIEHLAHHDPLTGLPNRRLFEDRLVQVLALASRARRRLALLYLDLDRFKEINDAFGHRGGDELLRAVSNRLAAAVRSGDTVARLGGDEFAVVQAELRAPADAAALSDRLLAAVAEPFRVGHQEVAVAASVGVALFPDDGVNADELRANADMALYSAKCAGRARAEFYRPELTDEAHTRTALRRDLARGIEAGELELHYQPKVAAADGSMTGLEALLRWQHPERGTLAPALFVPLAEETGLIEPLGAWVLAAACAQIGRWRDDGIAPPRVAVNLSPAQLRQGSVAGKVGELIAGGCVPPDLLELELTEHVLLDDDPRVHRELTELRRLGVAIALDDFGTGYSSLSYLHRLHLRTLKVDRSLVGRFGDPRAETICAHVVRLAHDLGLIVVAEGIETRRDAETARAIGFDELQGYWFAKPAPVAEITGRLRGWAGAEERAPAEIGRRRQG